MPVVKAAAMVLAFSCMHECVWLRHCFADRLATLQRLAVSPDFVRYKMALNATTPEAFIDNVSRKWSTDPRRGEKVLDIYKAFKLAVQAVS